jgi:hypothetical protein
MAHCEYTKRVSMPSDASSSSPLPLLLPDCKNHVLQFLTIQECCCYGTTSKTTLLEILPDLQRRRREQFILRHAYQITEPTILRSVLVDENDDPTLSPSLGEENCWHILPSVAERIQYLYRSLPSSHPFDKEVRDLVLDLTSPLPPMTKTGNPMDFQCAFLQFHNITKAHRLHASLLSQCTLQLSPAPCDPRLYTTTRRDTSNPSCLTVLLDHYIGDVLSAYYLLGHSIAGLVEGGPTHRLWTKALLRRLQDQLGRNNTIHAGTWYQLWVYLHSTVLRTSPFSPSQQHELGLSKCGIRGATVLESVCYTHPHYPYLLGTATSVAAETLELLQHVALAIAAGQTADHRTSLSSLGCLGPVFRGRDSVRMHVMSPAVLLHRLQHPSYAAPSTWFLVEQQQQQHVLLESRTFSSWFSGDDDCIKWMLELKQECIKSRPMTVVPPLVTIEPTRTAR